MTPSSDQRPSQRRPREGGTQRRGPREDAGRGWVLKPQETEEVWKAPYLDFAPASRTMKEVAMAGRVQVRAKSPEGPALLQPTVLDSSAWGWGQLSSQEEWSIRPFNKIGFKVITADGHF